LCDAEGLLVSIVPFTMLFYGVHSFFYYQHGQHVEGVTIIESSSCIRHGDPLGDLLFVLHYQTLLKTIVWAPNCVFPSLANDTHIVGPMNEITHAFDHLSAQLTLVGFKVKVSKCKLWNPSKISRDIKNFKAAFWSEMAYAFWVCQWVFNTF
jgi:hypothetical protein